MRILVFGAGVLGTLYAAKLKQAGHDVVILARGERLAQIRENGLLLAEHPARIPAAIRVECIDRLASDDAYDFVLVLVRKNQLASVLPALAASRATPNVLVMVNNAAGPQELTAALGKERVLLGFPGAGGQRKDGVVYSQITRLQPTTLGELDGQCSARLEAIALALRAAGFPVALCSNMDSWLKTHAALVSPLANAIYMAGGSTARLAGTRDGLVMMVRAMREGLRALDRLDVPVTPAYYRPFAWLPEPLLVAVLGLALRRPEAELVLARHANAARDEMAFLACELAALTRKTGLPTPHLDVLAGYAREDLSPLPAGSARLALDWRSLKITGALFLIFWILIKWRRNHR